MGRRWRERCRTGRRQRRRRRCLSSSKEETETSLDIVGLDGVGLSRTTGGPVGFGSDFGRVPGGEGGECGMSTVLFGVDLGVDVALLEHVAND